MTITTIEQSIDLQIAVLTDAIAKIDTALQPCDADIALSSRLFAPATVEKVTACARRVAWESAVAPIARLLTLEYLKRSDDIYAVDGMAIVECYDASYAITVARAAIAAEKQGGIDASMQLILGIYGAVGGAD